MSWRTFLTPEDFFIVLKDSQTPSLSLFLQQWCWDYAAETSIRHSAACVQHPGQSPNNCMWLANREDITHLQALQIHQYQRQKACMQLNLFHSTECHILTLLSPHNKLWPITPYVRKLLHSWWHHKKPHSWKKIQYNIYTKLWIFMYVQVLVI